MPVTSYNVQYPSNDPQQPETVNTENKHPDRRVEAIARMAPAVVSLDAFCRTNELWDVAEYLGAILDIFDEALTGTSHAGG